MKNCKIKGENELKRGRFKTPLNVNEVDEGVGAEGDQGAQDG